MSSLIGVFGIVLNLFATRERVPMCLQQLAKSACASCKKPYSCQEAIRQPDVICSSTSVGTMRWSMQHDCHEPNRIGLCGEVVVLHPGGEEICVHDTQDLPGADPTVQECTGAEAAAGTGGHRQIGHRSVEAAEDAA